MSVREDTRLMCWVNLAAACIALLITAGSLGGCGHVHPPSTPAHGAVSREFFTNLVVLIWFAGAIGLLYRKPPGWLASVFGSGTASVFFLFGLAQLASLHQHPSAEMNRLKEMGKAGYVIAIVAAGGFLFVLFAICLTLFIVLLVKRKQFLDTRA